LPPWRPPYANATRAEAARLITERAPAGFNKVFFTNGGADANENAIRMARLFTGREKVISRYRSYHGNTGAVIVATGDWRRIPNEYARGHVHVFGPYLYRSEFWAQTPEEECARALQHLERVIQAEGTHHNRGHSARNRPRHRRHPGPSAGIPCRRLGDSPPVQHPAHPG
jgi:taurine--2-oxoglutarate transaminase